jgi:hypothetical protein
MTYHDDLSKVEGIGGKKKKENPAIVTFYNQWLQDLNTKKGLSSEETKVHQVATTSLGTNVSDTSPQKSASLSSDQLPSAPQHPYGYNMFAEILDVYLKKEKLLTGEQNEITSNAENIYRRLKYVVALRQRIHQEKSKKPKEKDPVIDSINFSLPEIKHDLLHFTKKSTSAQPLKLDKELTKVLSSHGYDVEKMKKAADAKEGKETDSYFFEFDPSVSTATQAEFASCSKACAGLEYLQENNDTQLLTKEGKGRYDFSTLPTAEKELFVKSFKDLEQVVSLRCEQMPSDANQELSKLQRIHTIESMLNTTLSEGSKTHQRFNQHIIDRMGAGR